MTTVSQKLPETDSSRSRSKPKSRSEMNMEWEGTPPHPLEEQIAVRAYEIWRNEGCPEGRALDNWLQAERETLQQMH